MKSYKYRVCSVLFTCFTIWVFIFYLANFAVAAEYCVDTSAELQSALTNAENNGEDDMIRVMQGTYLGNFTYSSSEAYSLTIKAGYNHPRCKKRVVDPATTVLDGGNSGPVLVLSAPDVVANFVVDGITIRNGEVTGNLIRGGGLFVLTNGGTVTVSKSKIDSNSSPIEGGSGMYIRDANSLTLNNNAIINNNGGGEGGGCHFDNCSEVNIFDNTITGNSGWMGGGVYISGSDSVVMTKNLITNNTAHYAGGGAFIRSSVTVNLSNNILENNTSGSGGGGLWITSISSSVNLNKNTISNNTADHSGGAWLGCYGIIRLTNNTITYNTATGQDAGGTWVDAGFSNTVITNNTISYNSCNIQGGGIRIGISGTADLYNNIIWNNSGSQGADLFIQNNGIPFPVNLFNNFLDLISGVYIEDDDPVVFSNNPKGRVPRALPVGECKGGDIWYV